MKPLSIALCLSLAAASANAAATAPTKCIFIQQAPAAASADPARKFSSALRESRKCADVQTYELSTRFTATELIARSVVTRCKHLVDEQARYAVLADLGWTHEDVKATEMKKLSEKAVEAVHMIRAGTCPVTMTASNQLLAAK